VNQIAAADGRDMIPTPDTNSLATKLGTVRMQRSFAMSIGTKDIYDEHIKPLPREQRVQLLGLLQAELKNGDDGQHSILELHGLGKEIWQGIDPNE
jgi:hypothetical protein